MRRDLFATNADRATENTKPWPVSAPEPWEARAVNLSACTDRDKSTAWRRIKRDAPDVAAAMQRDLPQLRKAFGSIHVIVDSNDLEPNE